ncbi:hypothetical protein [Enorma burkinafasonensis]|uniref:hypothetical protein n=1 Tax=Enorma burkinafasonensis TaxID=2590867 RepID=UPI0026E9BA11|nr:hypothetical protein [Enorma burkinafasonensis]MCI7731080.1 hypothetical protein [Enorma burkinafasonensis]
MLIGCFPTAAGGLAICEVSAGALTAWCFGASPRVTQIELGTRPAAALVDYYHVETVEQLCRVIALVFGGAEGMAGIERLLERLELSYTVVECPVFEG